MKIRKYIFLIAVFLFTIICIMVTKKRDNKIAENEYVTEKLNIEIEEETPMIVEELVKQYPKEDVLKKYKGYDVCAKIEIPVISLEANIFSEFSNKALKVSCTKFWGVEPNQEGNFCVAGHNYKNMFYGIKKLKIGDTFFITDNEVGKVEYEIFFIDKVVPENVECLDAVTKGEKEVTLITCTTDSKYRIIVKGREKILDIDT